MQSTEKWLPVVGYEGDYEVSDLGRVRSLDRFDARGHRIQGRMLSLVAQAASGPSSRRTVSLHRGGRQSTRLVHHLVLEAFVGDRPDGTEACHWDGDPSNNELSNLRWDSHKANEADKFRHGTHVNANKTHCPRGHELLPPNLVSSESALGHRKCRACSLAATRAHRRGEQFDSGFANMKHAEILAGLIDAKRDVCRYGHSLVEPNLVQSNLRAGRRTCLACDRTRHTAQAKRFGFDPAIADVKYAEIMGGGS